MKVLCIGGLGFTCSHLVDALKLRGDYVGVLDNGSQSAVSWDETPADVVSVGTAEMIWVNDTIQKPWDVIVHAASPAGPARIKPGYALQPIIEGTRAVLDFAGRVGAKVIKFSTSEVYGRADWTLSESLPCVVQQPYDPRTEYQLGFLSAECLCFNHPHPDVQVLRLFNVTGPRQQAKAGVVLPRFCQQALDGGPMTVFGDGRQRRAFLDVDDLTRFVIRLIERWPVGKGIWNVANPDNVVSMGELAGMVLLANGDPRVDIQFTSGQEIGTFYRDGVEKVSIDISKARSIGWEPRVGMKEIVGRCLGWAREERESCAVSKPS